jgi:adenylosuccinate synthase
VREEMRVTVVVGGQYGSEGKGKVAQYLARAENAAVAVRVGGPNSGHTGIASDGSAVILRQLPTAALLPEPMCVLGAGSYIDVDLLLREIEYTSLNPRRLLIDENAVVVTYEDRAEEAQDRLADRIGSTCSGTGAAVRKRVARRSRQDLVAEVPELEPYVGDAAGLLRAHLDEGNRVLIEGTQGFGLSLLHTREFPYATSRDTSAAGAVSEAGLSPLDIDRVVLVLRTFPIRVAGNSGPLLNETDWEVVSSEGGHDELLAEYTSVTQRLRRVARFDPEIVRRAILVNRPSMIVLNHVDYVDASCRNASTLTATARRFVDEVEGEIGQSVDLIGVGPSAFATRSLATAFVA